MLLKCILLASVCIVAINGRLLSNSRRTNELLDSVLNTYKKYRRNYNRFDDNEYSTYNNKRSIDEDDEDEEKSYRNRKRELYNVVEDLVNYAREKRQGKEKLSDMEYLRNSIENQQFHNSDRDGAIKTNTVEEPVSSTHDIRMPDVVPEEPDTYLCYSHKLPNDDKYITKFEPVADMKTAHHMLLFGCETPFRVKKAWKCREMQPVCGQGSQAIKYAWGRNAPSLEMPKDVAFHVGGESKTKYLVIQVHYLNVDKFKDGKTKDRSGLRFTMTSEKPRYFAGIYLIAAGWPPIPPHKERFHMDMGCLYHDEVKFFPFRFRVHAHKLGAVITAYRIRNGKWSLIGRGDPQRPQAFYKVFNSIDIKDGDQVIGRCTFNSTTRTKTTYIGATHTDEMCNFYTMYFYDANKYGNIEQLPCSQVDTNKLTYPNDSDVTLGEIEKKASKAIHNQRLHQQLALVEHMGLLLPHNGPSTDKLPN